MLAKRAIEQHEKELLQMPQADCPVVHHFFDGIYIREVSLPAGTLAIGHAQRFPQLNIMLKGKVAIVKNGNIEVLEAPLMYMGEAGRKVGYIMEDTVWQNIYATTETDIEKLEEYYLDKSEAFKDYQAYSDMFEQQERQVDVEDYQALVAELGMSEEEVQEQVQNEDDQIDVLLPKVVLRDSNIHGKGVFVTQPVKAGECLGVARVGGLRTILGRYTNHSKNPNAEFYIDGDNINLRAIKDITGCQGGNRGEEITVNYRQAIAINLEMKELTR